MKIDLETIAAALEAGQEIVVIINGEYYDVTK